VNPLPIEQYPHTVQFAGWAVPGNGRIPRYAATAAAVILLSIALSGCLAAVPLEIGANLLAAGAIGSAADDYKAAGAPHVVFRNKAGEEIPVEPLPLAKRVAVWPGDGSEVAFAQKISARFQVTTPGVVASLLAQGRIDPKLTSATSAAQLASGFQFVCTRTRVELVFASWDTGRLKSDIIAYDCRQRAIVWNEQIELVAPHGVTSDMQAGAQELADSAWANRILDAESLAQMR